MQGQCVHYAECLRSYFIRTHTGAGRSNGVVWVAQQGYERPAMGPPAGTAQGGLGRTALPPPPSSWCWVYATARPRTAPAYRRPLYCPNSSY